VSGSRACKFDYLIALPLFKPVFSPFWKNMLECYKIFTDPSGYKKQLFAAGVNVAGYFGGFVVVTTVVSCMVFFIFIILVFICAWGFAAPLMLIFIPVTVCTIIPLFIFTVPVLAFISKCEESQEEQEERIERKESGKESKRTRGGSTRKCFEPGEVSQRQRFEVSSDQMVAYSQNEDEGDFPDTRKICSSGTRSVRGPVLTDAALSDRSMVVCVEQRASWSQSVISSTFAACTPIFMIIQVNIARAIAFNDHPWWICSDAIDVVFFPGDWIAQFEASWKFFDLSELSFSMFQFAFSWPRELSLSLQAVTVAGISLIVVEAIVKAMLASW
jgi:hypothetical protein